MSLSKSKSRKVNAYVKLVLKYRDAIRKADRMLPEIRLRRAALSGGQLAEATRLLQPNAVSSLPAPDSRALPPLAASVALQTSAPEH